MENTGDNKKSFIQWCCDFYNNLEMAFLSIFTLAIGALILIEIGMRNCGMQGIKWLEEMGRFMLVTTTLIGCSVAVKSDGHMEMDALYTVLKPRTACILKAIVYLFCSGFYIYLGYYSVQWMIKLHDIGKVMESVGFPSYVMWIFVSIGIITMGFRYLIQFKNCIVKLKSGVQKFTEMNTKEI